MKFVIATPMLVLMAGMVSAQESISTSARVDIVAELDDDIATLDYQYEHKRRELDGAYTAKVQLLRSESIDKLEKQQSEVASEDLDEAVRIREVIEELASAPTSVPGSDKINAPQTEKLLTKPAMKLYQQNKELQKKLSSLETLFSSQAAVLANQLLGKSYQIKFGEKQGNRSVKWTFGSEGVLMIDGLSSNKRWAAFGNERVVVIDGKGGVDVCEFADGGSSIKVLWVGDYERARYRHVGKLIAE